MSSHDPDDLFEEMRAALTNEEIASQAGIAVTREFLEPGNATLSLVFRGPVASLVTAHTDMATHGPHSPNLIVAATREEMVTLRELSPSVEIDFEDPSEAGQAVLTLTYTGPESPRDMATGYARCANLVDEARHRGLEADHEHDDHSLHITVRGPRDILDELATFADRVLNRTVDVQDDD